LKNIIFRVNAGNKVGMGHLSRCLSLAQELATNFKVFFIISTDDEQKVINFIDSKLANLFLDSVEYIPSTISKNKDLILIKKVIQNLNAFLIIDHYNATLPYQKSLKKDNIKWLQFDSHGKIKFLADLVLHGSPGATREIYSPLLENKETQLLLGPKYAIVDLSFREQSKLVQYRKDLNRIFMCFGGGNDQGATLKILEYLISNKFIKDVEIFVAVSSKNKDLLTIQKLATLRKNIYIEINSKKIPKQMGTSDLAIIPPGTLSYEAASVGLPMLLITLASNQLINAKGWVKVRAGINMGSLNEINKEVFINTIIALKKNKEKISLMSINCFKTVDGLGTQRTKEKILSIL